MLLEVLRCFLKIQTYTCTISETTYLSKLARLPASWVASGARAMSSGGEDIGSWSSCSPYLENQRLTIY